MTIRPRLFLEGNFFLDLRPGSPSAPDLSSGGDIPVSQTATAVQLDQILTSLQKGNRTDLKQALAGYGSALTHKPTPAEDKTQSPSVHGLTAGTGPQSDVQVRRQGRADLIDRERGAPG